MEDFIGTTLLLLAIFAYCCYLAEKDRQKEKDEQRERERQLLHHEALYQAKKRGRIEAQMLFVTQAKHSLANWSPIDWPEEKVEQVVRRPRKWGRHD